jgi:rhomboid protease GluP
VTEPEAPPPAPQPRPSRGWLARLRQAPATSALLVALIAAYAASVSHPELVERFCKIDERVLAGEWWRLFTASFLHAGLPHLAVNGYALFAIGPTVEELYGRAGLLLIFLLGGAVGFAASTLFVAAPSLGASAGLFALLGVLLGFALRSRRQMPPRAFRAVVTQIGGVALLNLAVGVMASFIDNAAHIGGFIGGLVLGLLLRPRPRPQPRREPAQT